MIAKPNSITGIGIVQVLLATTFVVWLLFFPSSGDNFAWPVTPALTAMFIGASFTPRAFIGMHLWRQKQWHKLRWQVWANLGFLAVIFAATFWHVNEMNWSSNIIVAHIWVLAYGIEPFLLFLLEPRGPNAEVEWPADEREGPIQRYLRRSCATIFITMMILAAVFFLNPEFANTRWPWELDPFNARIMAAFMVLPGLFALKVYFSEDWAEAKYAVQAMILQGAVLSVAYPFILSQMRETNKYAYGFLIIGFTLLFIYAYWDHERKKTSPSEV